MATNYWGSLVKFFGHNGIEFKDGIKIYKLASDPTSVAADAAQGSIGIFGELLYVKQDAGSSINWISYKPSFINTAFDSINEINGPVAHIDNLQKIYNHTSSAGVMHDCVITDNLDGTVDIGAGVASLRADTSSHSTLFHVSVPAQAGIALTDLATTYVSLDYNAGTPQFIASTSMSSFNCLNICLAYVIARDGNTLNIIDAREQNVDANRKSRRLFLAMSRFIHAEGGSLLAEVGTRNPTLTAGAFYFMMNEHPHPAFDTTAADTFEYWYKDATGWVSTTETQVDNTQYNDVGVGLTAMANNKFKVEWAFVVHDGPSTLHYVYSPEEYLTLSGAEASGVPSDLPVFIAGTGSLVGRNIIKKGDAASTAVESAFSTDFSASTPTDHNGLTTLQGGALDEYYHDTAAENARQILLEKESEVRWLENFRLTAPTTEYTESGGTTTGIIVDDATDELDGIQSAKVTTVAGNQGTKYTSTAKTNLQPVDFQTLGILCDWQYNTGGLNVDWNLVVEESTDGITYTENARLELPKEEVSVPSTLTFKLNAVAVITHYRHYFEQVGETIGAIARWDNVKVITRPFNYKEVIETESIDSYYTVGSHLDPNGWQRFDTSLFNISGNDLLTIEDDVANTRTKFIAKVDMQASADFSSWINSAGHFGIEIFNGDDSQNRVIPGPYILAGNGNSVDGKFALLAGQYFVITSMTGSTPASTNSNALHTSLSNPVALNITATATQSQVVFKGQATDKESAEYVPDMAGIGVPTGVDFSYSTKGDLCKVIGRFIPASTSATVFSISLPNSLTIKNAGAYQIYGTLVRSATTDNNQVAIGINNSSVMEFSLQGPTTDTPRPSNTTFNPAEEVFVEFEVHVNELSVSDPMISFPVTNNVENTYSLSVIDSTLPAFSENTTFVESVTNSAAGTYDIVFKTGFFGVAPIVSGLSLGTGDLGPYYINLTASGVTVKAKASGGAHFDSDFSISFQRSTTDYKAPKGYFLGNMQRNLIAFVEDQKPSGTVGGTGSTVPTARDLNTLSGDSSEMGLTLDGTDGFKLTEAGKYLIEWSSPCYRVARHKSALYNETTSTYLKGSAAAYAHVANFGASSSSGQWIGNIPADTILAIFNEIETSTSIADLGQETGVNLTIDQDGAANELYTQVKVTRLK